jgi:hypothetical protein
MANQHAGRACVLYDRVTGKVRHVHYSFGADGSMPTDATVEKRALALRLRGLAPDGLGVLHVDAAHLKPRCRHRVDLGSLTVTSEPLPRPKRR